MLAAHTVVYCKSQKSRSCSFATTPARRLLMKRLTNRQVNLLLASISLLHSNQETESFQTRILKAVKKIIPGEFFALDFFHLRGEWLGKDICRTEPLNIVAPRQAEAFGSYFQEHPLFIEFLRSKLVAPRKITDYVTFGQYCRTGIYNEFYRLLGVDRQMAIGFPATPEMFSLIALNRYKKDFTESERLMLTHLRPHIIAAYQNMEALSRLQFERAQLQMALEASKVGAILLSADGAVLLVTEKAQKWLAKYFDAPHGRAAELPEELTNWLAFYVFNSTLDELSDAPVKPLEIIRADTRLRVRVLTDGGSGQILLLLDEKVTNQSKAFESLGLTRREAEVLGWVALGKTDSEVALLCSISKRTVQKHLEHIYQKLGVETRTAAAHRALRIKQ
jgi:DNA-binding CsgD family transcriptional regulator